jgi:hypothetical protein
MKDLLSKVCCKGLLEVLEGRKQYGKKVPDLQTQEEESSNPWRVSESDSMECTYLLEFSALVIDGT